MRVLIASLATPGFVFPSIAVAERLRARGDDVAFVTDRSFAAALAARGFERLARSEPDGSSFEIDGWFEPLRVAIQVKHLQRAVEEFRPDVVLASNLALGPLIVRRTHRLPVAVLGPVVFLWPSIRQASHPAADGEEQRLVWRHADQIRHFELACRALGVPLTPSPYERSPLFGDRFLLQGVPELQRDADALPEAVRFVGSCALDALDVDAARETAWLEVQRRHGRRVVYVQLGRFFEKPSIWRAFRDWIVERDVAAIVCTERYDGAVDDLPPNVLAGARVPQDAVLPHADGVVCNGQPTAVLGAIAHGRPLAIVPSGSGTEELADACVRYGVAVVPKRPDAADDVTLALDRLLASPSLRAAAQRLRARFAGYDGPLNVCRALEELALAGAAAPAGGRAS
jgi:UDP:flavonoid glycosyltransferase YjiC (YdhE family)